MRYIEGGPRQWLSDDFYGLRVVGLFRRMIGRIKKKMTFRVLWFWVLWVREKERGERMFAYGWYDVGCYDFVMIVYCVFHMVGTLLIGK